MPAYSGQDKVEFAIKDSKYSIGQGVGNAFNKAVDAIIARGVEGKTQKQILEEVLSLRDMFFNENQGKIEIECKKWEEENIDKLNAKYGIELPTIQEQAL